MSDVRKQAQSLVDLGAKATTHHGLWLAEKTNGKGEPVLAVWASEGGIVCKVQTTRFEPATYHNPEFIAACGNHAPGIARAYLAECEAHERTNERLNDALKSCKEQINACSLCFGKGSVELPFDPFAEDCWQCAPYRNFLASIEQKEGVSK